jgi:UDP-glucose 4-epimerase
MIKKVLVTGGRGFIGSHVCESLLSTNIYEVVCVDNSPDEKNIKHLNVNEKFTNVCCSFDNIDILDKVRNKEFHYIIHLAAKPSVPYSIEHIYDSHNINVNKTIKLLECSFGNIEKFVFASSSAVYGKSFDSVWLKGISEDASIIPLSPYALQKYEIELYLNMMKELYSLNYVAFRFFNVYGPKQYGGHPYANVISSWLHNIKNNKPLRIDGDGSQKRDFIYVKDIAEILVKSLIHEFNNSVLNLGTNNKISCNDVLNILEKNYDNTNKVFAPKRLGDVYEAKACIEKFQNEFKYNFVPFEIGIQETINWWDNGCK